VFDNDGLLLDTEEAWTRAERTLFAGLGREFTLEHKRILIGSSRADAALKLEAILERPGRGSNSERAFLERTLASAGLLHGGPFRTIVSAQDIAKPKPAPDIYLEACRRLGADPAASVALEDSPTGAAAAAAAGMFVIGVPYFPDSAIPGADLIAPSLAEPEVAAVFGLSAIA